MVTNMQISIQNNQILFIDGEDRFTLTLHRTLRLPEDGRKHHLPPSCGRFPVALVDDYKDKVPQSWVEHGGVFFPMWQREAMWMAFASHHRPFAVKVAAGKINAVSGKPWTEELAPSDTSNSGDPRQDYLVAPPQPWLDGFNAGNDVIRQFVAMPLGMGYTVEGQVTGKETFGGIQIMAIPPKPGLLVPKPRQGIIRSMGLAGGASAGGGGEDYCEMDMLCESTADSDEAVIFGAAPAAASRSKSNRRYRKTLGAGAEMGLGQGGTMEQKIYPDPHGLDTWDMSAKGRLYVHIVNSQMYEEITGQKPPRSPITAQTYAAQGFPWFKLWDEEMGDVSPSKTLQGVQTIGQVDQKHGFSGQQDDSIVHETNVVSAGKPIIVGKAVKDGVW